ncbi:MAG: LamG domain-containing protein [Phycisphaerales bacterium]|nr:LamG domain-containing protein [Phycisphaerales bacterium]
MSNDLNAGLICHWMLNGDVSDRSRNGNDARVFGDVRLESHAAVFDGRGGYLVIPNNGRMHLGRMPFSMTARIWIDSGEAEVIGDIASQYDPNTRTGFNFSLADHGGVTCSTSNYRNLNFAIDAGTTPQWMDCGRVGNATMVDALVVHNGCLYASTSELEGGVGHVYRYSDGVWEDLHLPCKANSVGSLCSLDGALYAASGLHDMRGSSLGKAQNLNDECRVWRMEEDGVWTDCGSPPLEEDNVSLCVYRGRLYAKSNYSVGLYRYEGEKTWVRCAPSYPRFIALCQWRGRLYGASNKGLRKLGPPPERERIFTMLPDADGVYHYDDRMDVWTGCGKIDGEDQMYCFSVHRGALYVGTWPSAKMYRSTSGMGWEDCGRVHPDEKELMAVGVYNGMMYTGTLPAADIYRFDGDHRWTKVGQTDQAQGVKYRRAWSMAVHDGKLFVGTLPSGHVFAMKTGAVACDSRQLTTGWHDVAAVRSSAGVSLYLDGQLRAQCAGGGELDLSNDQPLRIGFGAYDYFRGKMMDVRLYNRAINLEEARSLCK